MFYVKLQNGDHAIEIEITDENVYTRCPACGDEKQIDIAEVLQDGDLYHTNVFCLECAGQS